MAKSWGRASASPPIADEKLLKNGVALRSHSGIKWGSAVANPRLPDLESASSTPFTPSPPPSDAGARTAQLKREAPSPPGVVQDRAFRAGQDLGWKKTSILATQSRGGLAGLSPNGEEGREKAWEPA